MGKGVQGEMSKRNPRRRYRRNRGGDDLTPELRAMRYNAATLEARGEILRRGLAAVITQEDIGPETLEACSEALLEATKCEAEADGMRLAIRAAQDAAGQAEEEIEPQRGRPLQ